METLNTQDLKPGDVLLFENSPFFIYKLYKKLTKSQYQTCAVVHEFKYGFWWIIEMGGVNSHSKYMTLADIKTMYGKFDIARNNKQDFYLSGKIFNKQHIFYKKFSTAIFVNLLIDKIFNGKCIKYLKVKNEWTGPSLTAFLTLFASNQSAPNYEFVDADWFANNENWKVFRYE
jgi:hypothetical protein